MALNDNLSLLKTEIKIGCAWGGALGKVVGTFIVLPIEIDLTDNENAQENSDDDYLQSLLYEDDVQGKPDNNETQYYVCEFVRLEFIRIYGDDNKYTNIDALPNKLKEEVEQLIGSKKVINSHILTHGSSMYINRPGSKQKDNLIDLDKLTWTPIK